MPNISYLGTDPKRGPGSLSKITSQLQEVSRRGEVPVVGSYVGDDHLHAPELCRYAEIGRVAVRDAAWVGGGPHRARLR